MKRRTCEDCGFDFIAEGQRLDAKKCEGCEDYEIDVKSVGRAVFRPPAEGLFDPPKEGRFDRPRLFGERQRDDDGALA